MAAIVTIKDFGTALKNGPYTSVGSYPVYFTTDDGEALSFATAWEERALIADAINNSERNGWRVVDVDVNWEDPALYDVHTGERIESAYAEDDAEEEPAKIPESYRKWRERMRGDLGEAVDLSMWIIERIPKGGWRIYHQPSGLDLVKVWLKRDAERLRKLLPTLGPDPNGYEERKTISRIARLFSEMGARLDTKREPYQFYVFDKWPEGS